MRRDLLKEQKLQLLMSADLHLKHVSRLCHNIWCCEVDPLFCRGVGEMEAARHL